MLSRGRLALAGRRAETSATSRWRRDAAAIGHRPRRTAVTRAPAAHRARHRRRPAFAGTRRLLPPVSPIRGLIDFHTHAAPDVFGRAVDDDELAALAAARQMEAVVFKNHVALTADRAWLARKHVPGIKVFGGIILNGAVGGINTQAVEWMWRMQGGHGRVVWFPTFDADNHVRRAGTAPSGIRVVDERGAVLPGRRARCFKVCAAQRLVDPHRPLVGRAGAGPHRRRARGRAATASWSPTRSSTWSG